MDATTNYEQQQTRSIAKQLHLKQHYRKKRRGHGIFHKMYPHYVMVLVLAISAGSAETQSIINKPINATYAIGETAKFKCKVEFGPFHELLWEFNNTMVYYSDGKKYPLGTSKYEVLQNGNKFTLAVKDLNLSDGGEYTCSLSKSRASAFLVVLGTPQISSHPNNPVDGHSVKHTCEAQFGGPRKHDIPPNHFPQLRMFIFDGQARYFPPEVDTKNQGNYYNLSMHHNMTVNISMLRNQIRCEIRTINPAKNVTNSKEIDVLYKVCNTTYSPKKKTYLIGSSLTCSADGNPPASFQWENVAEPGNIIPDHILNIDEEMIGANKWECISTNTVQGKSYEDKVTAQFIAAHAVPREGYAIQSDVEVIKGIKILCIFIVLFLGVIIIQFGIFIYSYMK